MQTLKGYLTWTVAWCPTYSASSYLECHSVVCVHMQPLYSRDIGECCLLPKSWNHPQRPQGKRSGKQASICCVTHFNSWRSSVNIISFTFMFLYRLRKICVVSLVHPLHSNHHLPTVFPSHPFFPPSAEFFPSSLLSLPPSIPWSISPPSLFLLPFVSPFSLPALPSLSLSFSLPLSYPLYSQRISCWLARHLEPLSSWQILVSQ